MGMDNEHDILVAEASATLGSLRLALKWLHSPCECLDQNIPAEVAKSREGYKQVLDILYRIRGTIVHHPAQDSTWYSPRGRLPDTGPEHRRHG